MTTALLLTFLSGCSMAAISMIVSGIAREKISFLQYYTVSNLLAAAAAFLLYSKWSLLPEIDWIPVLLITAAIGLVNVLSQGAMVCSFKWGHNGLSTAIRNSSAMLTMFWGMIFLQEKISLINFAGVILVFAALSVIAVSRRKYQASGNEDLRKWIPAVTASLLLSGIYQILLSGTALLPENVHKGGVLIPCFMAFCALGNFFGSLLENKFAPKQERFYRFPAKVWLVMLFWLIMALVQYFLLVKAIVFMKKFSMGSLTWPLLVGVNVTAFSLFCRLKWKEKYPLSTVLGIVGCVLGIILIIYGRK